MKIRHIGPLAIVLAGAAYFLVPLAATFSFSLSMQRDSWSFEAYRAVFGDQRFLATLAYSAVASLAAIVLGVLLIVPTVYWVRLKLPKLRPIVEFLSLLPLIIPPIVLVFGYIRLYGSNSFLPLTASVWGTNLLLVIGYVALSLPYMFRSVDNGMQTVNIRLLTEAAESLGATRFRTLSTVILPNVKSAIISGAFLTFSISLGEFVFSSLLSVPAFGPYLMTMGEDRAYEPSALAILTFGLTWVCMVLMQAFASRKPGPRSRRGLLFNPARKAVP